MHLCFVSGTDTCRSPMAALVAGEYLSRAGLRDRVRVTSAGIGPTTPGAPADRRATEALAHRGYPVGHVATLLAPDHHAATALLAMDQAQASALRRIVVCAPKVRLLREFDPAAPEPPEIPDPFYGGPAQFREVLTMIEATMPTLVTWVESRLGTELTI
ncbi:protein tyrosine phosphatase [Actinokineospora globicatena]|uniref:arsenate reductase/protein-tyrosine-phosphatase family protein n=1 Tax=Actinokineospora globicatena TaxID=103729 RepID=UPI0020A4F389|nr:protein tyrosine phosphatase [Actinokineospora globicatena]MCP2302989.1 protein-tyrosine phosphatase [Actinokineospora globicatena]GLW79904.1 protein-tyrosine-phosphatase [Actinokineospora globicatena]GLW85686.1 protein-tyrosine-phosphatase [Actinokineospora globicatena]